MGNRAMQRRPDPASTWGKRAVARQAIEAAAPARTWWIPRGGQADLAYLVEEAVACSAVEPLEFAGGLVQTILLTDVRRSVIRVFEDKEGEVRSMVEILRATAVRSRALAEVASSSSSTSGGVVVLCFRFADLEKSLPEIREWLAGHPDYLEGAKLLEKALTPVFDAMELSGPGLLPNSRGDGPGLEAGTESKELDEMVLWSQLKALFYEGIEVMFPDAGGIAGGRVKGTEFVAPSCGAPYLLVHTKVIMSDGKCFYFKTIKLPIVQFAGRVAVNDLPVRPMDRETRGLLRERGKKFTSLAIGPHFRQYEGAVFVRETLGVRRISAPGRIMLDGVAFSDFNPNYPFFKNKGDGFNHMHRKMAKARAAGRGADAVDNAHLREVDLHLTWPTLPSFSLSRKVWAEAVVDNISPIAFRDDAFDHLVLDSPRKALLQSLVEYAVGRDGDTEVEEKADCGGACAAAKGEEEARGAEDHVEAAAAGGGAGVAPASQGHASQMFTDVIDGKGGGCIFLLHGPPGVGKTLTAEAIAELLHRPLYSVGVGELGTNPREVDEALRRLLELAERWNAVTLLDEADIFLEERSADNDIVRNAMVSVFLRCLEYHQGVLFLTTNRMRNLDHAFHSRVSVTLQYSPLDEGTRYSVWKSLLSAASAGVNPQEGDGHVLDPGVAQPAEPGTQMAQGGRATAVAIALTDQEVRALAKTPMNGRQIKTAIRLSLAVAAMEAKPLSISHVRHTLQYSNSMPDSHHKDGAYVTSKHGVHEGRGGESK